MILTVMFLLLIMAAIKHYYGPKSEYTYIYTKYDPYYGRWSPPFMRW